MTFGVYSLFIPIVNRGGVARDGRTTGFAKPQAGLFVPKPSP